MLLNFLMNVSLKCYLTLQASTPQNGVKCCLTHLDIILP